MALKGDLDSLELGQVFQMLALNHKEGVLGVFTAERPRALRFGAQGVTLQFDPTRYEAQILEKLRRRGDLTPEKQRLADANRRASGRTTVEILVEMGFLSQEELDQEYRSIMEEQIYEIFFLQNARFEFFEGRFLFEDAGGVIDERFSFNCDSIVMEAARRVDEWELIRERVPDTSEILIPAGPDPDPKLLDSVDVRLVLQLADGWRSIAQIIEDSNRTEFEISKACMVLMDAGVLVSLDPRQYSSSGVNAMAQGRCAEAANLFERAAERGFGLPEVLGAAGRAREENDDYALAAERYRQYALSLAEEARLAESARALLDAAELIPTDLWARKELVSIGMESPEVAGAAGYDPVTLGKVLYHNFSDAGDHKSAQEILELLIAHDPDDMELRQALISCLTSSGDQKKLIAVYEETAEYLIAKKERTKAVPFLQKILMIDRSREDMKAKIKDLYQADKRRRTRRRGTIMILAGGAFLAVVGGLYAYYEHSAAAILDSLDIEMMIDEEDFDTAKASLEDFRSRYPLSLSSFRAHELLARVEAMQHSRDAKQAQEEHIKESRRQKQIKVAQEAWDAARSAIDGGIVDAVNKMKHALEVAPQDWNRRAALAGEIEELSTYLADAQRFLDQARELERDGKLDHARRLFSLILGQYSRSPVCRDVMLPVRIETIPPHASVQLGGAAAEQSTPIVIHVAPDQVLDVVLSRRGFEPRSIKVDGHEAADQEIRLQRRPDPSIPLPSRSLAAPLVDGDRVYMSLAGGRMVGVRLLDGEKLFTYSLPDLGELYAAPAVADGTIFLGDSNGRCVALLRGGRTERWVSKVDGSVRSTPQVAGSLVIFVTREGRVFALDRASGRVRRSIDLQAEITAGPVRVGDSLVIGTSGPAIVLLDLELQGIQRRIELASAPAAIRDLPGRCALVVLDRGDLIAFDFEREKPALWEHPGLGPSESLPGVQGQFIYLPQGKDLLEIDVKTGVTLRRHTTGHYIVGAPICVGATWIYLASQEGHLVAMRRQELDLAWEWGEDLQISSMAATQSLLLVARWSIDHTAALEVFDTADEWKQ